MEFTELIGTLYFQKKKDMPIWFIKSIFTFAEELRREIQVDVEDVADDERSLIGLAQKTGMSAEEIGKFIRTVRPVIYGGQTITAEQMKQFIG